MIRGLGERAEEERRESRGDSRAHVPYRDSKLTRILASSLGGNARTAVVTCVSDATSAVEATRAALFFASQAKRVTNRATVNEVRDAEALVRRYRAEIAELRRTLAAAERAEATGRGHDPALVSATDEALARAKEEARVADLAREKRKLVSAAWNDFYFAEATAATTATTATTAAAAGLFPARPARTDARDRGRRRRPRENRRVDVDAGTVREPRGETSTRTSTPTPLATGSTRTAGCSLVSSVERFVGRFDSRWARRALPRDASRARVDARMRKPSKP